METTILAAIERAADTGRPCPTNKELASKSGAQSASAPTPIIRSLEQKGIIIVRRFGQAREVEIVATGRCTLHEGERKPRRNAVRKPEEKAEPVPPARAPRAPRAQSAPVAEPEDAAIDRPRVMRDPCPLCGVRGDIGCRHAPRPPAWAGGPTLGGVSTGML